MIATRNKRKSKRLSSRGIGLAELLITIAITASLLTAAAAGLDASIKAYSINQAQADTLHRARLAMHRLSTYLRTSTAASPITESAATDFASGVPVTDIGVGLFDASDNELTFRYDADNQQLIVTENATDHVLLRNVTAFSIRMTSARSALSIKTGGGFDLLDQATITLSVRTADNAPGMNNAEQGRILTLSTSVSPRGSI